MIFATCMIKTTITCDYHKREYVYYFLFEWVWEKGVLTKINLTNGRTKSHFFSLILIVNHFRAKSFSLLANTSTPLTYTYTHTYVQSEKERSVSWISINLRLRHAIHCKYIRMKKYVFSLLLLFSFLFFFVLFSFCQKLTQRYICTSIGIHGISMKFPSLETL